MRSITVKTDFGTPITIEPDEVLMVIEHDNRKQQPTFIVGLKYDQSRKPDHDFVIGGRANPGLLIPIRVFPSKKKAQIYFLHLKDQRRGEVST